MYRGQIGGWGALSATWEARKALKEGDFWSRMRATLVVKIVEEQILVV